jgi:hypothetical protein
VEHHAWSRKKMCHDIQIEVDEEMVGHLTSLIRNFFIEKGVNYDTITETFDDSIDGTYDGLVAATGNAITSVFITDVSGLKQYLNDLFYRWDIDECSRSLFDDGLDQNEDVRLAAGRVMINHIFVKAVSIAIVEYKQLINSSIK